MQAGCVSLELCCDGPVDRLHMRLNCDVVVHDEGKGIVRMRIALMMEPFLPEINAIVPMLTRTVKCPKAKMG
jgi:hypothetical protein